MRHTFLPALALILSLVCSRQSSAQEIGDLPAIHLACAEGDLQEVKRLITKDSTLLHLRDDAYGMLPLHYAAAFGRVEVVEWLVQRGCDPLARTSDITMAEDKTIDLSPTILSQKGKCRVPNGITLTSAPLTLFLKEVCLILIATIHSLA